MTNMKETNMIVARKNHHLTPESDYQKNLINKTKITNQVKLRQFIHSLDKKYKSNNKEG